MGAVKLEIEVSIKQLLTTLYANREQHQKDYLKAKAGWVKLLRKELVGKLEVLDNGGVVKLSIDNQKPENHGSDYDDAIEMLEYAAGTTITLNGQQYQQFVKDNWQWKNYWAASNSTYIESA